MIYLENSTEEQTIYIPRENTDTQSIKPIPTDILADYYTKKESNNIFATKQEVNEKVANLQEQIDNGGGSTSNVVYIYAQEDDNITDEQWLEIVENYPNKNYKIVTHRQSFEENGKEYKNETIVEVVGVDYEQYPQLEDNNGTIYNDCTIGYISGYYDNTNFTWSREFGDYGYEMYLREEGIPSRQEFDRVKTKVYNIHYKDNLSLDTFNRIKDDIKYSKVILNFDFQYVEIIKTTDNVLFGLTCYWENNDGIITYHEFTLETLIFDAKVEYNNKLSLTPQQIIDIVNNLSKKRILIKRPDYNFESRFKYYEVYGGGVDEVYHYVYVLSQNIFYTWSLYYDEIDKKDYITAEELNYRMMNEEIGSIFDRLEENYYTKEQVDSIVDNGGGSSPINVYGENWSFGDNITEDTATKIQKSRLTLEQFDEIITKLTNNERVIIRQTPYMNIEIVSFLNNSAVEISFMGFLSSRNKGTYLGKEETSNVLVKWVKEDVDGTMVVNVKYYNLSYLYNATANAITNANNALEIARTYEMRIDQLQSRIETLENKIE